jgi:GT2 family glycosyltransferase
MGPRRARGRAASPRAVVSGRYSRGFDAGFDRGYDQGYLAGREAYRNGLGLTSIIIPTRNRRDLLEQCIASIRAYTPEPHEIIVIDNGSSDGTGDYLRGQTGRLRYRIAAEPLGFAGAVNQGLRMSVGETILFLNNDTVVTERWLGNLLACLRTDPERRLVGPVTNYISGVQRIDTDYGHDLAAMHRFAAQYNRSDPSRWEETERLTGFCVLMHRTALQRIGFLDEGFREGNLEDDDYGMRARLLGMGLWVAKDTFIHHVGSASMKSLGEEQLQAVNAHNAAYYGAKWAHAGALVHAVRQAAGDRLLSSTELYPTHVLIRASGGRLYWLEGGVRYRIPPMERYAAAVPLLMLRGIPYGGELALEDWTARFGAVEYGAAGLAPGVLVGDEAGAVYQFDGRALRRFAGPQAIDAWGLRDRNVFRLAPEELRQFPEGLPILAPETIVAGNL